MSERIMGIEIGNSHIKMIEVSKKGALMTVHKFSLLSTPEGSINNGVISEPEAIKKVIAQELAEKKYRAKKVVNVVQSSQIIIRNVTMEKQPEKIIKQILDMKIEDYLPVECHQYQIDYKVLRTFTDEATKKEQNELLLVAAPNQVVMPLASLMKSLKLVPVLINIPSEAICNVFGGAKRLIYETSPNILVLDIGGHSSNVTIISGDQAVLNRYIDFGVEQVNQAVDEAQQKHLTVDEVAITEEEIFEIVRPQIEYNIISEIERILQFYYSNFNSGVIKKIYLIGGGANIKGMRGYIRDALNIPTEKLAEFSTVTEAPDVTFEPYRRFFVNIIGAINGL